VFSFSGSVDFYINSQLKWAVDLLRDGGSAEAAEHVRRFAPGGIYHPLLQPQGNRPSLVKQHMVLHFISEARQSQIVAPEACEYVQAVVSKNSELVEIRSRSVQVAQVMKSKKMTPGSRGFVTRSAHNTLGPLTALLRRLR
jgi:hypothetical protein